MLLKPLGHINSINKTPKPVLNGADLKNCAVPASTANKQQTMLHNLKLETVPFNIARLGSIAFKPRKEMVCVPRVRNIATTFCSSISLRALSAAGLGVELVVQ